MDIVNTGNAFYSTVNIVNFYPPQQKLFHRDVFWLRMINGMNVIKIRCYKDTCQSDRPLI